jgi:hypothetical protein
MRRVDPLNGFYLREQLGIRHNCIGISSRCAPTRPVGGEEVKFSQNLNFKVILTLIRVESLESCRFFGGCSELAIYRQIFTFGLQAAREVISDLCWQLRVTSNDWISRSDQIRSRLEMPEM